MAPESEKSKVMLVGHSVATFDHIRLEIELREPSEAMKEAFKNEMLMGLMGLSQMLMSMGEQFGFMDVVRNGGSQTTATLCLSPILSFELGIYAPTAIEGVEAVGALAAAAGSPEGQ